MQISSSSGSIANIKSDCLLVPLSTFKNKARKLSGIIGEVDLASNGKISKLIKSGDICQERFSTTLLFDIEGLKTHRIIIVAVGDEKTLNNKSLKSAYRNALKRAEKTGAENISSFIHTIDQNQAIDQHIAFASETLESTHYQFTAYKKAKTFKIKKLNFVLGKVNPSQKKKISAAIKSGKHLAKGISVCKDLGNLPGNICTPSYLANEAKKLDKKGPKVSVKVIDEKSFERLGMGAFLSVAKGSEQAAKLIIIDYKGGKSGDKPHVLVGKGITFDSGGISLKPGAAMDEMKYDMCGAASVFGTMNTIIDNKLKLNVIGVVAAAENMPSSRASKPGDIVTTMSGKTVEILNTDAEGRLVLCDALTYVERFKPASVVDIATLTGACVMALGHHATAVYSNSEKLSEKIIASGEASGDRAWPMPLWDEYQSQIKSPFADLANVGGRAAGSVTAACFLSHFAKKYTWAHLDIAGTAWVSGGMNKGSTGRPVALLTHYLESLV